MGKKILDFHDILLREEDIDLLRGSGWLNDQVISFFFEYLAHEKHHGKPFGFVGGSLGFFLAFAGPEDGLEATKALKLETRDVILMAVNDSSQLEAANSGSHWSLLVYCRDVNAFRHYDSSGGINSAPARKLALKMHSYLGLKPELRIEVGQFPMQVNGYDCGVYVIGAADIICRSKMSHQSWDEIDKLLCQNLGSSAISQLRVNTIELIQKKARQASQKGLQV